ncbi:MAG: carboxypeptidase regulatory-like domain-containing protein, partial [Bryobacteraceae bacterium]|nr:carboxypeptidase regulatory-like domain-containing protein [Bryobacteraceae bacterium]
MRSLAATFGVALLLLLPGAAHAQTTFASITGTITDGTGAVVPNASITVRSLATNIETRTTSNDVGNYTVPQLKEGPYSVRATAHGFNEVVVGEVFLVARDVRRIDLVLPVGASTVAIEVTAGATVIET